MKSSEIYIYIPEMATPQVPDEPGKKRDIPIYPRPVQIPERKPVPEPIAPREPLQVPQREPVPSIR